MNTEAPTFPLPGWTRDWSRPVRRGGSAFFEVEARGYLTPCWQWKGATSHNGYGLVRVNGRTRSIHRVVYEDTVGRIPVGLQLDHLCRNRLCCRPDHLEPVTSRENTLRGETLPAANAGRTHCPRGHEYSGLNLYVSPAGKRVCRACRVDADRRYRESQTHRRNAA